MNEIASAPSTPPAAPPQPANEPAPPTPEAAPAPPPAPSTPALAAFQGASSFDAPRKSMASLSGEGAPAPALAVQRTEPDGPDSKYDGWIVGAGGTLTEPKPGTNVDSIAPVTSAGPPAGKARTGNTVIYVAGIQADRAETLRQMQGVANGTGDDVIAVFNATENGAADVFQAALDRSNLGSNRAVETLAQVVLDKLQRGEKVHLEGYSQGAIIVSRALQAVSVRMQDDLRKQGLLPKEAQSAVEAELERLVEVETFGGAASWFPNGPRYVHYINDEDPVAANVGLGLHAEISARKSVWRDNIEPGRNAAIHYLHFDIDTSQDPLQQGLARHSIYSYAAARRPFEEAYRAHFSRAGHGS